MPTDTEKRIKELLKGLAESGTSIVGEGGKELSQLLKEQEAKIASLEKENKDLKNKSLTFEKLKEIFGEDNFDKETGKYKGVASTSNQQPTPTPPAPKPEE